jgi:hypothetical protein
MIHKPLSKRTEYINGRMQPWLDNYQEKNGHAPSALAQIDMHDAFAIIFDNYEPYRTLTQAENAIALYIPYTDSPDDLSVWEALTSCIGFDEQATLVADTKNSHWVIVFTDKSRLVYGETGWRSE